MASAPARAPTGAGRANTTSRGHHAAYRSTNRILHLPRAWSLVRAAPGRASGSGAGVGRPMRDPTSCSYLGIRWQGTYVNPSITPRVIRLHGEAQRTTGATTDTDQIHTHGGSRALPLARSACNLPTWHARVRTSRRRRPHCTALHARPSRDDVALRNVTDQTTLSALDVHAHFCMVKNNRPHAQADRPRISTCDAR